MAAFHYVVRAKLIRHVKGIGEIDFLQFEEKFESDSPITARTSAFGHYQNYIDVLLEAKNANYSTDRQTREDLRSFIDLGIESKIQIGGDEVEFSHSFGNGIGIFLIVDKPKSDDIYDDKKGDEILIHGIGNISFINSDPDQLMYQLESEIEYYQFNNYDVENKIVDVLFCSRAEWEEGYLGNGKWRDDSYKEPCVRHILETPFDWTGLDNPYWWGEPNNANDSAVDQVPKSIQEIIQGGESNQVEFKPALLYNFFTGKGSIGVKGIIAKAICAFLNSNGGILIIGVTDKGEFQGLSNDFSLSEGKNSKDFFMLEFDQMLKHFLSFSIKNNVSGEFYQVDGKDIFVVKVAPSKRRPIFLKGQNGKEFYVRGEASSRQLADIEELVNYCFDKWGTQ